MSPMKFLRFLGVMGLVVWGMLSFEVDCSWAEGSASTSAEYPTLDTLANLNQPYLGSISAYEPIYFLVGANPEDSKFQLSFSYRLIDQNGPLAASSSWVNGLHFGYTQVSFWDLKSDSAPFEDTSYKPELFHLTTNLSWRPPWMQGLFLQSGVLHESNGRGGDASRNTNILYIKPVAILFSRGSSFGIQVAPKVWGYFKNSDDSNGDLPDYRGYFAIDVKVGKSNGLVAGANFRWAKEGGSVQVDLNYPLHQYLGNNLAVDLQIQYVNTLAESLLNYRERTEAFRMGLSFMR